MATTAVGASSSVTRTVSATVAGVSPGPPNSSEWHTSSPAALAAAVDRPHVRDGERLAEARQQLLGGRVDAEVDGGAAGGAQQPEHVRVAHTRLQVAGERDVRERGPGAAPAHEQLLADSRHVALVGVEGRVDDELLGRAEVAPQPHHLVGDRLGRAAAQARALEPRIGAVDAAVRTTARRLDAGGAIATGAGEDGGEVDWEGDAAEIVERLLGDSREAARPSTIRRAAGSPSPTTPSRDEQRAANLARKDREGRAAEDDAAPAAPPRVPRPPRARTSPCRCGCAATRHCLRSAARGRRCRAATPGSSERSAVMGRRWRPASKTRARPPAASTAPATYSAPTGNAGSGNCSRFATTMRTRVMRPAWITTSAGAAAASSYRLVWCFLPPLRSRWFPSALVLRRAWTWLLRRV